MAKVELKNLTKIYGSNTVVDHINLEIENGTLVSILGPSGCGKTTTLRTVSYTHLPAGKAGCARKLRYKKRRGRIYRHFWENCENKVDFGRLEGLARLTLSIACHKIVAGKISIGRQNGDDMSDNTKNFENVTILTHPLLKHKISRLRDKNTGTNEFRKLIEEIAMLMGYEALRDLPTEDIEVETPIETCMTPVISGKKMAVIPILRAGLGMVGGILALVPSAKVGHIGMYRDEETHEPQEYYCKLPEKIGERIAVVVDPMLATGGSAIDAVNLIKQKGGKNIKSVSYTHLDVYKRQDKIILSPGPGRPEDAGICEDAVRAFCGKIPILGVCLGHQAICEAFGAKITYAGKLMHGKQSEISADEDCVIFRGLGGRVKGARYHSLAADPETMPPELQITAAADDGEIMAVKHRDYDVYGLQFHPESILTPQGKKMLENFIRSV